MVFRVYFLALLFASIGCLKKTTQAPSTITAGVEKISKSTTPCVIDHPEKNIYKVCTDQRQKFIDAQKNLKPNEQIALVFGANWCEWCHSLHNIVMDKEFTKELEAKFKFIDIALFNGKKKIPEAHVLLKELLKVKTDIELKKIFKGLPFIVLYNPKNKKIHWIDTAQLEDNSNGKGHNKKKVAKFLNKSYFQIK